MPPSSSRILLMDVGEVVEVGPERFGRVGRVPSGSVLVDGLTVSGVSQVVLRDRRHLAEDGIIVVTVALDRETGELLGGPDLLTRGVVAPDGANLFESATVRVRQALQRRPRGEIELGYFIRKINIEPGQR